MLTRVGARGVLAACAAAGVLVLLALAARSTLGPLVSVRETTAEPRPPIALDTPTAQPEMIQPSMPPVEVDPAAADVVGWIMLAVGAAVALALLILIARWLWTRHWSPPAVGRGGDGARPEGGVEVSDEEIAADVHETLAASIVRLRSGIPVEDAIVECWRRLESVAAASGVDRQPTDTAEEFRVTVLRHTAADPADLRELADLYRGAMFGARPPDESDRERAIACLTKLLDALEGAHA